MSLMFCVSKFNGDISRWDISSVKNMREMFHRSRFYEDISGWNRFSIVADKDMFLRSTIAKSIGTESPTFFSG